jgi:galactokinase
MTGGGFGGSAIALIPSDQVGPTVRTVLSSFEQRGFAEPVPRLVYPSDGARPVSQG